MIVLKFGGTSVGTPASIRQVMELIKRSDAEQINGGKRHVAVVFSAFGGVTNGLLQLGKKAKAGQKDWEQDFEVIKKRHIDATSELVDPTHQTTVVDYITELFKELRIYIEAVGALKEFSNRTLALVVSFGERLSTFIICHALRSYIPEAEFLDARKVVVTDNTFNDANVDFVATEVKLREYFESHSALQCVTGFIGATPCGETTCLGRGAGDYSAAILGSCLKADEIHIWTDVPGVLTADPRKVGKGVSKPIHSLSYNEALEFTHFGAKVLMTSTMAPAMKAKIPIRIKNTFQPDSPGTIVCETPEPSPYAIRGVTSLENVALLHVTGKKLQASSDLSGRILLCMAKHDIQVLLVSQASVLHSFSVAIPEDKVGLAREVTEKEIQRELETGVVERLTIDTEVAILSVVGLFHETPGVLGTFTQTLGRNGINVYALASGPGEKNISCLIPSKDVVHGVQLVHAQFFEEQKSPTSNPIDGIINGISREERLQALAAILGSTLKDINTVCGDDAMPAKKRRTG